MFAGFFDIFSAVSDNDIRIRGNDGGSTVTALTLDMSAAGAATFNAGATFAGDVGIGTTSPNLHGWTTAVTLNTESGQITMNGAELAGAAEVTFQVNNDKIAATDVVVVNHSSAGTAGSYLVQANSIAAGSFKITVANVGSTASEAIVLSFVALKGASS